MLWGLRVGHVEAEKGVLPCEHSVLGHPWWFLNGNCAGGHQEVAEVFLNYFSHI